MTGADTIAEAWPGTKLGYRSRWLSKEEVARIGWSLGPEQSFLQFGVATADRYNVDLLVHRATANVRGYLYAFHGG